MLVSPPKSQQQTPVHPKDRSPQVVPNMAVSHNLRDTTGKTTTTRQEQGSHPAPKEQSPARQNAAGSAAARALGVGGAARLSPIDDVEGLLHTFHLRSLGRAPCGGKNITWAFFNSLAFSPGNTPPWVTSGNYSPGLAPRIPWKGSKERPDPIAQPQPRKTAERGLRGSERCR